MLSQDPCVGGVQDPISGYCTYSGGTITSDHGTPSVWDNIFRMITAGGQVATEIIRADHSGYTTPYGTYPYGSGNYSAVTYPQAQAYLQARGGTVGAGGGITIGTSTLLIVGLVALLFFMRGR